ncbi:MAG: ATP-dependent helicase, partial [Actinobacteria bacterium]|nr:ATP-dependent helicase [Actinomycetota bacterium]
GSMINNFIKIHSRLSGSGDENILYLKKNYRNSLQINSLCRDFISLNEYRIKKESLPKNRASNNSKAGFNALPVLKESGDVLEEVKFISDYVKKLIVIEKVKPEKICIVIKGLGYKTDILENNLSASNILFIRRGTRNVLDNKYVKYMLDFASLAGSLKLLHKKNIDDALQDEKSSENALQKSGLYEILNRLLIRLLSSEITGINPVFVRRIAAGYGNILKIIDIKNSTDECLIDVVLKDTVSCGSGYNEDFLKAEKFISRLKTFLNLEGISAYDFFIRLLYERQAGIIRYFTDDIKIPVLKKEGMLGTIGDFLTSVKLFCKNNKSANSISDYLVFLKNIIESGFIEEIEESTKSSTVPGYINIMSYHQCKGMEFDAVLLPFINKDYLPSAFKDNQLYDMQIFNYISEGKTLPADTLRKRHYEDERKLFYTGISRAKRFLLITSNANEGRSAFFEEMRLIYNYNYKKNHVNGNNKKNPAAVSALKSEGKMDANKKSSLIMNAYLARKKANVIAYKLFAGKNIDKESLYKTLAYIKLFYPTCNWWRLRAETENNKNPSGIYENRFSYTSLSTYSECPAKYKYRYYFSLKEDKSISVRVGTIYHAILKKFYDQNTGGLSWGKLENIINSEFSPEEFNFPYLYNELALKAIDDFRNYFNSYACHENGDIFMEKPFFFYINDKIIKGRVDSIRLDGKDKLILTDFKSGKKNSAYSDAENEIQMPLYWLALKKSQAFYNCRDKNLVFKYIFLGGEKTDELVFDYDLFDFDAFELKIIKIIEKIEKEEFRQGPKSRFLCKDCAFNLICKIRHEPEN